LDFPARLDVQKNTIDNLCLVLATLCFRETIRRRCGNWYINGLAIYPLWCLKTLRRGSKTFPIRSKTLSRRSQDTPKTCHDAPRRSTPNNEVFGAPLGLSCLGTLRLSWGLIGISGRSPGPLLQHLAQNYGCRVRA
jgi:hypothetical protein